MSEPRKLPDARSNALANLTSKAIFKKIKNGLKSLFKKKKPAQENPEGAAAEETPGMLNSDGVARDHLLTM